MKRCHELRSSGHYIDSQGKKLGHAGWIKKPCDHNVPLLSQPSNTLPQQNYSLLILVHICEDSRQENPVTSIWQDRNHGHMILRNVY